MSEYNNSDCILFLLLIIFTIFYIGIFNKNLSGTYGYYLLCISPFIIYYIYKYCYNCINKLINYCNSNKFENNIEIEIENDNHNNIN